MPRESFSTHSATNSDTTPNVCATVAPPWSVVTRPDRSRSGSSAPPAHMAVPTASCTGVWWKCAKCSRAGEPASQAAAPDSAWEGPIMAATVPGRPTRFEHHPLWTSRPCRPALPPGSGALPGARYPGAVRRPRPGAARRPRPGAGRAGAAAAPARPDGMRLPAAVRAPRTPAPRPGAAAVARPPGMPEHADRQERDRDQRPEEVRAGQQPGGDQQAGDQHDEGAVAAQPALGRGDRLRGPGQRLPPAAGQVGGERGELVAVLGGVDARQPLVALLQGEPALGGRGAQDLGDLLALLVRGADPAAAGKVGGHLFLLDWVMAPRCAGGGGAVIGRARASHLPRRWYGA